MTGKPGSMTAGQQHMQLQLRPLVIASSSKPQTELYFQRCNDSVLHSIFRCCHCCLHHAAGKALGMQACCPKAHPPQTFVGLIHAVECPCQAVQAPRSQQRLV